MARGQVKMPYARRDGQLHHVDCPYIANGRLCGCSCPSCGRPVIAKRGSRSAHHFAHIQFNGNCVYPVLKALYELTADILRRERRMWLPMIKNPRYCSAQVWEIEAVSFVSAPQEPLPTLIVMIRGTQLWIDLRLRDEPLNGRVALFRSEKVSAIGIRLSSSSDALTEDAVQRQVLEEGPHKMWLYNAESVEGGRGQAAAA